VISSASATAKHHYDWPPLLAATDLDPHAPNYDHSPARSSRARSSVFWALSASTSDPRTRARITLGLLKFGGLVAVVLLKDFDLGALNSLLAGADL
jgi:hypothetical protein